MNYKGSILRSGYLYRKVTGHPHSGKQGYVAEHRIVMEKHLGRFLNPEEVVHHINGDRSDNRIENLELFSTHGQHTLIAHKEVSEKVRASNTGRRPPNYNRGVVKCLFCGEDVETTLGSSGKKFCNKKCYWLYKKGKPSAYPEGLNKGRGWNKGISNTWSVRGKDHPRFKHGKYSRYPTE